MHCGQAACNKTGYAAAVNWFTARCKLCRVYSFVNDTDVECTLYSCGPSKLVKEPFLTTHSQAWHRYAFLFFIHVPGASRGTGQAAPKVAASDVHMPQIPSPFSGSAHTSNAHTSNGHTSNQCSR
eukprot:1094173-Pelagomonas_calceolata.AAC.7